MESKSTARRPKKAPNGMDLQPLAQCAYHATWHEVAKAHPDTTEAGRIMIAAKIHEITPELMRRYLRGMKELGLNAPARAYIRERLGNAS